jgi:hypothetical protein
MKAISFKAGLPLVSLTKFNKVDQVGKEFHH